jgi:hypothetical protein
VIEFWVKARAYPSSVQYSRQTAQMKSHPPTSASGNYHHYHHHHCFRNLASDSDSGTAHRPSDPEHADSPDETPSPGPRCILLDYSAADRDGHLDHRGTLRRGCTSQRPRGCGLFRIVGRWGPCPGRPSPSTAPGRGLESWYGCWV